MAIDTLLPKKLVKTNASYKSVIELNEALSLAEKEYIRTLAFTGPFGSGKSSVLITLMENFAKKYKFLPISLATLQANEEENKAIRAADQEEELNEIAPKKEKRIENLNLKIEYCILQQLIYREKTQTVPNSCLKKIVHLSKSELVKYPLCCVLTLLCFLIVFEPAFAKVDSIYDFFSWGNTWNTIFDFIASGWLLYALYKIARYVFRSNSNSKLNKLNLKDGEIVVKEFAKASCQIYKLISQNPQISAVQMAENVGLSTRQVQKYLKRLQELGKITRVGGRKIGEWKRFFDRILICSYLY